VSKTKKLVFAALLAALSYGATAVLMVPSPTGGYMNLGDAVVLLGAFLLGPGYGALAGAIGPALADLLSGYMMYVPGTLVIKGLMALTAAWLYRLLGKTGRAAAVGAAAAETIMVVGYWLYDGIFLLGSLAGSAVGIPSNLMQAIFGALVGVMLSAALRRSAYVRREFPEL